MKISRTVLLILAIHCGTAAYSQQNDAAFWPGLKLNYKFSKHWSSRFFAQERVDENVSRFSNLFGDISLAYSFNKHITLEGAYVYVVAITQKYFPIRQHQAYFDICYKKKIIRHLQFKYMGMWQTQITNYNMSETGHIPDYYIRNKFQIDYRITKHIEPFCFFEFRNKLFRTQPGSLNRFRYNVGVTYQFTKHYGVELYYMIQQAVQEVNPERTYIFGINFLMNFKLKHSDSNTQTDLPEGDVSN